MYDPMRFRGYYMAAVDFRLRRLREAAEARGLTLHDMDNVINVLERACQDLEHDTDPTGR